MYLKEIAGIENVHPSTGSGTAFQEAQRLSFDSLDKLREHSYLKRLFITSYKGDCTAQIRRFQLFCLYLLIKVDGYTLSANVVTKLCGNLKIYIYPFLMCNE